VWFPPQAFICPKDATPSFQYSNIPTFQLRSEAELSSEIDEDEKVVSILTIDIRGRAY
jgi:hypothetical protein